MTATNHTANYDLSQFTSENRPAWSRNWIHYDWTIAVSSDSPSRILVKEVL